MESTRGDGQTARTEPDAGVVRGCPIDVAPVRSLLRVLDRPRFVWGSATATIAAGGSARTITASGPDRFEQVRAAGTALFDGLETLDTIPDSAQPRLYGGFAFTEADVESTDNGTWHGYPDALFVLPSVQVAVTSDGAWLTTAAVGDDAQARATRRLERWRERVQTLPELGVSRKPGVTSQQYTPTKDRWREQIETVVDRIQHGDLRKVVLAQSLRIQLQDSVSPADVLARLGTSYPGCHRFLFEPPTGETFFGATPERLVSRSGETVDTEALAGSIGRGETDAEDQWLETQLAESEKNNHEHDIVVEAIREQLTPLTGDIVTGTRTVRKLANVQHLQTPIRATLDDEKHVLSLVEALHPTPAVGGLPPKKALRTIHETESFDRGWYAAPVGWFDADGDGTFAVAIRSGIADEQTATLFAGAGIVSDSDPDEELDELGLKYRPILDELS